MQHTIGNIRSLEENLVNPYDVKAHKISKTDLTYV